MFYRKDKNLKIRVFFSLIEIGTPSEGNSRFINFYLFSYIIIVLNFVIGYLFFLFCHIYYTLIKENVNIVCK